MRHDLRKDYAPKVVLKSDRQIAYREVSMLSGVTGEQCQSTVCKHTCLSTESGQIIIYSQVVWLPFRVQYTIFNPHRTSEMMAKLVLAFLALGCVVNSLVAESSFLSDIDKARLKNVIELKDPLSSNDLSSIYYNVHVSLLLEKTLPEASKVCSHIQAQVGDNLDSIYFITSTAKLLGNCPLDANKYSNKLQSSIQAEAPVIDLYRAGTSLVNLGKPIDSKLSKLLLAAIKRDESLLNTGLAFQLASKFTKPEDRNVFVDKIGDIIVQADEVNGQLLQVIFTSLNQFLFT